MKEIYGFKVKDDEEWGDIFYDEDESPEKLISSACHMYHDLEGNRFIGFDLSLDIPKKEMKELLSKYSKKNSVRKVL